MHEGQARVDLICRIEHGAGEAIHGVMNEKTGAEAAAVVRQRTAGRARAGHQR